MARELPLAGLFAAMKYIFLGVALILATTLSFLFAPPPTGGPDEYWGTYASLNERMGFVINGDSREYLADAKEPARLLLEKEVRQSRPLYILLAAGLGYALQPVLGNINVAESWGGIAAETPDFLGFYAAYVLLNFAVLLASLYLFRRLYAWLTAGRGHPLVLLGLSLVLVSNPITKAFFWTAHQQMFTFFTPLLCLWGLLRYRTVRLSAKQSTAGALALGLLPLVYGNFVLLLPCLLYQLLTTRAGRWPLALAGQALLAVGAFALPTLLWIGLLKAHGVTYYNHEAVRFHQFVWLLEAWQQSAFWTTLGTNLLQFLLNLRTIGLLLVAVAGLALARRRWPVAPAGAWAVLGVVFGLFFTFYALLGYYPERLTFTLVPVLLTMLALLLGPRPGRYQGAVVLAAALGWHLYVVFSYGPFS